MGPENRERRGALLRRLNGGCPETGLRKRQFGEEAEARVGPRGCEGPQADVQEAKESQAQGSGGGPRAGIEVWKSSGEKEKGSFGVCWG